jgi:hypothetical protein
VKTREFIAWGAVVGMLVVSFSTMSVFRGPSSDAPGEATTRVLGIVVDRVPILADPDGRAVYSVDRVQRGLVWGLSIVAVGGGVLGGLLGWALAQTRRARQAELDIAPDPSRR